MNKRTHCLVRPLKYWSKGVNYESGAPDDLKTAFRMFGFQNTELYRHYVLVDCAIAHSKALGD